MSKKEVITANGMHFKKSYLIPNVQGVYDTDPCKECHLNIPWVDYEGEKLCFKVKCNRHTVWSIIGGVNKLKPKLTDI